MTFDPAIPQPSDFLSVSQGELLTNMTQLNTVFGNEHIAFDDGVAADRGKHNQLVMPEQGADVGTGANEGAAYTKDSGTQTEWYFREESNGDVIQMTLNGRVGVTRRAFCRFAGATGTSTVNFGCTSARTGAGTYTITLSPALANTNYAVFVNGYLVGDTPHCNVHTLAVGSFLIQSIRPTTGVLVDPTDVVVEVIL